MGLAQVRGAVISGITAVSVGVEVEIAAGLPTVGVIGLADTAVGEARWRLRSAFNAGGFEWPQARVTIGLSPADLPKRGTSLDLAMAVGVVQGNGRLAATATEGVMFFGELGLDGTLRDVRGALAAAVTAARLGCHLLITSPLAARQAAVIPGVQVVAVPSLRACIDVLSGVEPIEPLSSTPEAPKESLLDYADVRGHAVAKFACEVAAAGRHHMALTGSPGVGKTMLAERLITILPPLTSEASIDVTTIASLCGQAASHTGLVRTPPFQAPHHSASATSILGTIRSGVAVPGLLTMAHHGVLFLDEAAEFARPALEGLRQPLESGWIGIARAGISTRLPADVQLILAANPCPCGYRSTKQRACTCDSLALRRYAVRLSGPLFDRLDLRLTVSAPTAHERNVVGESSATIAARVAEARERAAHRFRSHTWCVNSAVPGKFLRSHFPPDSDACAMLERWESTGTSLRGSDRLVRMAWSICDLRGATRPDTDDVAAAFAFRGTNDVW